MGPTNGHWTSHSSPLQSDDYRRSGKRYRVAKEFVDFDGDRHPVDERWLFLGSPFLPYDDGLSLFVSVDGTREWHIRLQQREETQKEIIEDLETHAAEEA
ncbi:hypothetical protein Pan216_56200 [Planctomycetes bacterium Pan216]|uniref:DUF3601 domain-containing protein n=1 Tax=Kolteria novifilia TaxID=2527975 RepID=A0A518BCL9_9BACT|nr:hypothetical protein Pan216_56200 [Planctomycetes bacterium Pan216]